jgi:hypothetical protein
VGVHVGEEPEEEEGDGLDNVATMGGVRSTGAMGGGVKSSSEADLWREDEDNLGDLREMAVVVGGDEETDVELKTGERMETFFFLRGKSVSRLKSEDDELARILFLVEE